jgi:hypothetical protein
LTVDSESTTTEVAAFSHSREGEGHGGGRNGRADLYRIWLVHLAGREKGG